MALPASFLSALAKPHVPVDLWLEIEGLPHALGMTGRGPDFFRAPNLLVTEGGVQDPGFETGVPSGSENGSVAGWAGSIGPDRSSKAWMHPIEEEPHGGKWSLRCFATGAIRDVVCPGYIPVTPGEVIYGEGWLKTTADSNGDKRAVFFHFTDENKANPTWLSIPTLVGAQTEWRKFSGTVTVPAGRYFMRAGPSMRADSTVGTAWFDDLYVQRPSVIAAYARAEAERRERVLAAWLTPPSGIAQQVRQTEGDSSIGSLSIEVEHETLVGWLANVGRTDAQVALGAPFWKASEVVALNAVRRPSSGSAAAGAGSWFRCTVAGTTGSSEPAWPASGTVADGTATWTRVAAQDLPDSATAVDVPYSGSVDAALLPTTGGVFYLGRETFAYTSRVSDSRGGYFTGITRGYYRLPGRLGHTAHTDSDLISPYPRFLATRRAVLYATLDGTEANKVARWAGTIRDASMPKGLARVKLDLASVESELKVKVFGKQITGKVAVGCYGPGGEWTPDTSNEPTPLTSRVEMDASTLSGRTWADGERVLLRVDEEYVSARLLRSGASVIAAFDSTADARGLFGSDAVEHHVGEPVAEVLFTGAYSATGSAEFAASRFTQGDHPLEVILQFLLSRRGDGANGTWDVLPEGWGLGLDQSRVDVAGITALRDLWLAGDAHRWVYDEPFSFKSEMARILKARLCYPVTLLNDVLTIRRMSAPIGSTAGLRAIAASKLLRAAPSWKANLATVVGRVRFLLDYDPSEPRSKLVGEIAGPLSEAQEFYAGVFRVIEIDGRGLWTGSLSTAAVFGSGFGGGGDLVADRYFDGIRDRRARPFPTLDVEIPYSDLDVEVGDQVLLTVEQVPNPLTGERGLSGALAEITEKKIDDRRGAVALTVELLAYASNYRRVAPSAIVQSGGTVSGTYFEAHAFSAASSPVDVSHFSVGDVVHFWSADLATFRGERTIAAIDAGTNTMTWSGGALTLTAGDVVMPAAYASATAAQRASFAFLADASDAGALASDPPHHYSS